MSLEKLEARSALEMMKTSTWTNIVDLRKRYDHHYPNFISSLLIDLIGYQILLLSGPPGLGKTTLAYVVARQAGYEVMEINARLAISQITFIIF